MTKTAESLPLMPGQDGKKNETAVQMRICHRRSDTGRVPTVCKVLSQMLLKMEKIKISSLLIKENDINQGVKSAWQGRSRGAGSGPVGCRQRAQR